MCLGVPGQVVRLPDGHDHVAVVDVGGVRRDVNLMLLDEPPDPGDWVLVHVGFAMAMIDEDEARATLGYLQTMGQAYADEMNARSDR
jgi:hydrogenase expression/formation protein HypC